MEETKQPDELTDGLNELVQEAQAELTTEDLEIKTLETNGIIRDDQGHEWAIPAENLDDLDDLRPDYNPLGKLKLDPRFDYHFDRTANVEAKMTEGFVPVTRDEVGLSEIVTRAHGTPTSTLFQQIDATLLKIPKVLAERRQKRKALIAKRVVEAVEPTEEQIRRSHQRGVNRIPGRETPGGIEVERRTRISQRISEKEARMPIANVNAPTGFRLLRSGGTYPPKRIRRPVAASRSKDLMVGDAYVIGVSGAVVRATAATDLVGGIVEAIGLTPKSGSSQGPESQDYIPAADAGYIIGIEDPNALFVVMSTTFAVATDVGKTAAVVDVDGNQALAQSRQSVVLDATGGHLQFKIVELYDSPADNATGAFADVVVRLLETL